jgi:FixJ family two-component response regulator
VNPELEEREMEERQPKVLVVDDEQIIRESCNRVLQEHGYETVCVPDGTSGLKKLKKDKYDVVLTDLKMPGMSGLEVLESIREIDQDVPVIVITGYGSVPSAVEAMKLGALEYVQKPFSPDELLDLVAKAAAVISRKRMERTRNEILEEVRWSLHETLNPEEVLNHITEGVVRAMGVKGSSLSLLDKDRTILHVIASHGLSDTYLKKSPIEAQSSTEEMISTAQHILVADVATDPRVQYPEEAIKEGIRSILSVPLIHENRVVGAVCVHSTQSHAFTEEDIRLLYQFADQAWTAIDNARNYEGLLKEQESLKEDIWEWYEYDAWRIESGKKEEEE